MYEGSRSATNEDLEFLDEEFGPDRHTFSWRAISDRVVAQAAKQDKGGKVPEIVKEPLEADEQFSSWVGLAPKSAKHKNPMAQQAQNASTNQVYSVQSEKIRIKSGNRLNNDSAKRSLANV